MLYYHSLQVLANHIYLKSPQRSEKASLEAPPVAAGAFAGLLELEEKSPHTSLLAGAAEGAAAAHGFDAACVLVLFPNSIPPKDDVRPPNWFCGLVGAFWGAAEGRGAEKRERMSSLPFDPPPKDGLVALVAEEDAGSFQSRSNNPPPPPVVAAFGAAVGAGAEAVAVFVCGGGPSSRKLLIVVLVVVRAGAGSPPRRSVAVCLGGAGCDFAEELALGAAAVVVAPPGPSSTEGSFGGGPSFAQRRDSYYGPRESGGLDI